jgi:streptomycin 6-kinase
VPVADPVTVRRVVERRVWRKRARSRAELRREVEALRLLGPSAVRLLRVEGEVLVLERVWPGTPAAARPDDEALAAITATLLALWTPVLPGCGLPTVRQECTALDDPDAVEPLPAAIVHTARRVLDQLLREPAQDRVLHGDLHQRNLLWSEDRGWVAIDPHGVVGDPGYDVGPLLINPWNADPAALLCHRLPLLAQRLDMPVERVAGWGLVRAVLAEAWHVQDTGQVAGGALQVAERLARWSIDKKTASG